MAVWFSLLNFGTESPRTHIKQILRTLTKTTAFQAACTGLLTKKSQGMQIW